MPDISDPRVAAALMRRRAKPKQTRGTGWVLNERTGYYEFDPAIEERHANLASKRAAAVLKQSQSAWEREKNSLAGALGQAGTLTSSPGGRLFGDALADRAAEQDRVALELAQSLLDRQSDISRQLQTWELSRRALDENKSLAEKQLELGWGRLGLDTATGMGDLGLRRDALGEQGRQFDVGLEHDAAMRELERKYGIDLSQLRHGQELETLGRQQTFAGEQAQLGRDFQAGQSDADRALQRLLTEGGWTQQTNLAQMGYGHEAAMQAGQQQWQSGENQAGRSFQAEQAALDRDAQINVVNLQSASQIRQLAMQLAEQAAGRQDRNSQFTAELAARLQMHADQIEQGEAERAQRREESQASLDLQRRALDQSLGLDERRLDLGQRQQSDATRLALNELSLRYGLPLPGSDMPLTFGAAPSATVNPFSYEKAFLAANPGGGGKAFQANLEQARAMDRMGYPPPGQAGQGDPMRGYTTYAPAQYMGGVSGFLTAPMLPQPAGTFTAPGYHAAPTGGAATPTGGVNLAALTQGQRTLLNTAMGLLARPNQTGRDAFINGLSNRDRRMLMESAPLLLTDERALAAFEAMFGG